MRGTGAATQGSDAGAIRTLRALLNENFMNTITVLAVGDVAPSRPNPDSLFTNVAPLLRGADIAFCQLEINLTERGERLPQVRHTDRAHPDSAQALQRAGFD